MNIKELQRKYPEGKIVYEVVSKDGEVLDRFTYDHKPKIRISTVATDGKLYKAIDYPNGARVQIPIKKDGTVKWFDDSTLLHKK